MEREAKRVVVGTGLGSEMGDMEGGGGGVGTLEGTGGGRGGRGGCEGLWLGL